MDNNNNINQKQKTIEEELYRIFIKYINKKAA